MKKLLLIYVFFCLAIFQIGNAQEETEQKDETENNKKDSVETDDKWEFFNPDSNMVFDFFSYSSSKKNNTPTNTIKSPTITLFYGLNQPSVDPDFINLPFNRVNSMELKIGTTDYYNVDNSSLLLEFKRKDIFLNNTNIDFGSEENEYKFKLNSWTFGFEHLKGYGWSLGANESISLYHSSTINWTKTEFFEPEKYKGPDTIVWMGPDTFSLGRLNRYGDSFRFGDSYNIGLNVRVYQYVALEASYGQQIIFERFLFWKWALSQIIEVAGSGLLDVFVTQVSKSSPWAVPVVNAALKGGLSYGLYQLYKKDMNWPSSTASPLMFEHFKFGLSFTL